MCFFLTSCQRIVLSALKNGNSLSDGGGCVERPAANIEFFFRVAIFANCQIEVGNRFAEQTGKGSVLMRNGGAKMCTRQRHSADVPLKIAARL